MAKRPKKKLKKDLDRFGWDPGEIRVTKKGRGPKVSPPPSR